ncbi:urea ABC transporter permease subunit UrtC [Paracoccus sanguinis]|uniref:Amino acid/amide ABC transporter membrane protein 2, HAAT family n=1 Tax=Paracoccus sanguinis TaxID=1545044 RepID=A0A099G4G5_9RHOB|nr:urea ABC transporter permease subunit UrtC [Paracoccus sanguinis]KGJ16826.1 branched-chain amino acid ABC transporter permease [Paracoccus sanguinis]KGJ17635.1 branched-chain amino acid ABC transporter permease [Paracoccus sanguinis]SDX19653.1 amino acid/amide ABC transporter membrane protein 2, HAAT family [Paracoccus sanguinis]
MLIRRHPALLTALLLLALATLAITLGSEAYGSGTLATSTVKLLGKTLCLALAAVAMDLVWGYAGILSLGHMAFFALGGYMIGQWLMYARTAEGVAATLATAPIPPTPAELAQGTAAQIFGVVGSTDLPWSWTFAHSLPAQLVLVLAVPGLLAALFGWLAFRARVNGVYLSILTQAMTLALALWLFQNDAGFRGNNGLSGLQNIPGAADVPQSVISIRFLWASAFALACGMVLATWITGGKFGSVIRAIRDDEARVRFLGYPVETFKLTVFTLSAMICGVAGALYYPQAGIINPAELMPIASIYLAVWVAIGGRGRIYGAIVGAIAVSLLSSWFTGGRAPDLTLGPLTIRWVDWWQVLLGFGFVAVTLLAPRGLSSLWDALMRLRPPRRHGADLGPDLGALREREAQA